MVGFVGTGGKGEVAERTRKEEKESKSKGNSTKAHEKKDDKECLRICYQMEEGSGESIHDVHAPYIIHINSMYTEYKSENLDSIRIMSKC